MVSEILKNWKWSELKTRNETASTIDTEAITKGVTWIVVKGANSMILAITDATEDSRIPTQSNGHTTMADPARSKAKGPYLKQTAFNFAVKDKYRELKQF